ncbi:MAG: YebC/PmpR family DNA-binding transcriptional regulator [Chloroflexi bacterium]|nr:YebC/PmpR family DNA-binding transcriptional regulator [Chloroflexota bacterium]
MSGHSKWSTIKHAKAATDAKRGQLFTKLTKEIIVAAKQGGGDVEANFRLRMAVQKAKDSNMPNDNIDRAIKKGTGESGEAVQMDEVFYEGYGPGGTAIMLEVLTDNRNRTASAVRSTFTKSGGSVAEPGAVAWQFDQRGVVVAEVPEGQAEDFAMSAIDAGASDFETDDNTLHVYSPLEALENIRRLLTDQGAEIKSSEIAMLPKTVVAVDDDKARQALRLLDKLEELEDVQKVYSNADFSDAALEEYGAESE